MDRRDFLRTAAAAGGVFALDAFGTPVVAQSEVKAHPGPIAYGSLDGRKADRNGIVLPEGFVSSVVAIGGERVGKTSYAWHAFSDGAACIDDGEGWYYVSNSEVADAGGASMIRFDSQGRIVDAARILSGTSTNCSGGATPWKTWLSCEEVANGFVWECDPSRGQPPRKIPALGEFRHEAVAVDPLDRVVYLTEDEVDGLFYRFVPAQWPSLDKGRLEALKVGDDKSLQWLAVPQASAWGETPTRKQVVGATAFNGGEGVWIADRTVLFTTKGDNVVHRLDPRGNRYSVVYDLTEPLSGVDQLIVDPVLSNIFVAEDGGNMEIVVIDARGNTAPFLRVEGHDGSEISGLAFAPDLSRLYFSSQRAPTAKTMKQLDPRVDDDRTVGAVYEVRGPFTPPAVTGARVLERAGNGNGEGRHASNAPYAIGGAVGAAAIAAGALVAWRQRSSRA